MFIPDYRHLENAAKNKKTRRIPLYEHYISASFMEKIMGKKFGSLIDGDFNEKKEFFRNYNQFQRDMGYDAIAYECCVGSIMPGSGALGSQKDGVINTRRDFDEYPWGEIPDYFFDMYSAHFMALREEMPEGMKAVGGVGNGIFECVQDIVGFENLCYIKADDEQLYEDLFAKIGDILCAIWSRFLNEFGDIYCVCRFGDDLGFKSSTLLSVDDIRKLIVPQYKRVIDIVRSHDKPFLLHSCGCIFDVMDDLISIAGINAKHSNEDTIAPFSRWIEGYGDRIGNFGGLDTDVLCDLNDCDIIEYTTAIYRACERKGYGVAIGSGNSIPEYVSADRYFKAVKTIRKLRGE